MIALFSLRMFGALVVFFIVLVLAMYTDAGTGIAVGTGVVIVVVGAGLGLQYYNARKHSTETGDQSTTGGVSDAPPSGLMANA